MSDLDRDPGVDPRDGLTAASGVGAGAVLELRATRPDFERSLLAPVPINLRLRPGDCIQIVTRHWQEASAFADLCQGLVEPAEGSVLMQGLDWTTLATRELNALRGRVGRTQHRRGWNDTVSVGDSILLAPLHHTRIARSALLAAAQLLCARFGLPGLPSDGPEQLSEGDLARANCVRAFLGAPSLLLVEPPVIAAPEVLPAFLASLVEACQAGAAAICFSRRLDEGVGAVRAGFGALFRQRFVLNDDGLRPLRSS